VTTKLALRIFAIYGGKLSVVLLGTVFVLSSLVVCSCRRDKEDARRVVVKGMCRDILSHPELSERTKRIAERVLTNWNNEVLDPEPILVYAGCSRNSDKPYHILLLEMADEEFDVVGFKVTEVHRSDPNAFVIEESYPVFPENRIGHPQLVRFQPRQTASQRKNEEDWDAYTNLVPQERRAIYRRGGYPVVWISLPDPPTVEVEISIFDSSGIESEPVPLEYGPRS